MATKNLNKSDKIQRAAASLLQRGPTFQRTKTQLLDKQISDAAAKNVASDKQKTSESKPESSSELKSKSESGSESDTEDKSIKEDQLEQRDSSDEYDTDLEIEGRSHKLYYFD